MRTHASPSDGFKTVLCEGAACLYVRSIYDTLSFPSFFRCRGRGMIDPIDDACDVRKRFLTAHAGAGLDFLDVKCRAISENLATRFPSRLLDRKKCIFG